MEGYNTSQARGIIITTYLTNFQFYFVIGFYVLELTERLMSHGRPHIARSAENIAAVADFLRENP